MTIFDTPDELAIEVATDAVVTIGEAIRARGRAHVMFASGISQLAFLEVLTGSPVDWTRVVGFHMDEYIGIDVEHPASFARYMHERIDSKVHPGAFHFLRGDAPDVERECERYAALLHRYPLDLCCLGIGENGHLAFNDPPVADFDDPRDVKAVTLDEACRRQQVGEGHFASIDDVPARAITVTIPALLRAGHVVAVVPERRKAEPVRAALDGPIDTRCPASVLQRCAHASVYLDSESASLLAP